MTDNKPMKKSKPKPISDQIRMAMAASGVTRYQISKATGIDQTTLGKFQRGERGLSLESIDVLGQFLGLRITISRKPQRKKDR